jgi:hypothetical protein
VLRAIVERGEREVDDVSSGTRTGEPLHLAVRA